MKNNRKWIMFLFLLLAVTGVASGCSSANETAAPNAEGNETQTLELVKFEMAAGNNNVANALTVVAKYGGFYEEEGLDVNLNVANTNMEGLSPLMTGKIQVAGGGATAPLNLIEEGNDLVIIGGAMTEGAAIVVLPERLQEWAEITQDSLDGLKIGVTRAQSGDIAFRSYLVNQGIDINRIEFVELDSGPTIIEAIKKGAVDAGSVFMTNRETAEEQGLVVAKHIDELAPGFICCRVVTTQKQLEERREDFVSLMRAQIKAYRLYQTDQEATIDAVKNYIILDDGILVSQLYDYGHLSLTPNPAKNKVLDFYDGMKLIGYVEGTKDIGDYVDTTLFEEAILSLLAEEPEDAVFNALYEEYLNTN